MELVSDAFILDEQVKTHAGTQIYLLSLSKKATKRKHTMCLWLKKTSITLTLNPHVVPTYGGLMGMTYGDWRESIQINVRRALL